jgi:hypothetical protein
MNKEALKAELERKASDLFEKRGGSLAIQAFYGAKKECLDAGVPEEEVTEIVHAASQGSRRP